MENQKEETVYNEDYLIIICPECGKEFKIYDEGLQNYLAGIEVVCDICAGIYY